MAKLVTNTNTSLMGTGMNVLAKLVPVSEIKTIPELENIFQKQDKVVTDIKNSMQEDGFHSRRRACRTHQGAWSWGPGSGACTCGGSGSCRSQCGGILIRKRRNCPWGPQSA